MKNLLTFLLIMVLSNQAFSQDWPNLSRFQKEDSILQNEYNNGQRIVFMGNSITEGWIRTHPDFFKDNDLINRGISGQTTPQMLLRFRQDVLDLKPKAVLILAGINDIAGNTGPSSLKMIEDNYESMYALAREAGIRVIFCSVLPANKIPWRKEVGNPAGKVQRLNEWLQGFAKGSGSDYVDYYSVLADEADGLPEKYSKDGVHPNSDGYDLMEKAVLPVIKEIRE